MGVRDLLSLSATLRAGRVFQGSLTLSLLENGSFDKLNNRFLRWPASPPFHTLAHPSPINSALENTKNHTPQDWQTPVVWQA